MSQRRASWTPGQGNPDKKASGPKTTMVRADEVRRVERKPVPRKDEPESEEAQVAVAGSGRGLPVSAGPAPEQAGGSRPVVPGGPSPFSGYAPTAEDLTQSATAGAESSNQITAIVLGMGFVFSMITILVMVILAAGLFVWAQKNQNDGLADGEDGQGHIRDTAVAPEIIKRKPRPRGGGGGAGDQDPEDGGAAAPAAPTTGPVTVKVPDHVFFHSMEINCPDAKIRRRAKFRGSKASTNGVPLHEECILTFQGSQPATAKVSGGQVLDCVTFNPTECRVN